MSNSNTNYSHQKFDFKLSKRKLFDFQLADYDERDESEVPKPILSFTGGIGYTDNFMLESDWDGLKTSNETIPTYGLTAIDNGAIEYTSEYTITSTPLNIPNKFELKKVEGNNGNISYVIDAGTDYVSFRGGFYQGFYKLEGYDFQSLPNRYKKGWTIQTSIQPKDSDVNDYTLNDDERDTSGFFFYTGTRAENKFWNTFEKDNGYGEYDGVEDEGFTIPINPPRRVVKKVDNEFLIYGRSGGNTFCGKPTNGLGSHTADTFDQGSSFRYLGPEEELPQNINQFLKYGRGAGITFCGAKSKDGYGQAIADQDEPVLRNELDIFEDIIDNAIGFRVKPNGAISFRRILPIEKTDKCITLYDLATNEELETFIFKYVKNGIGDGDINIEFNDIRGNVIYPYFINEAGEDIEVDPYEYELGDFQGAKCVVYEECTAPNLVNKDRFYDVTLKWVTDNELKTECDEIRTGKLYVYVDTYLKHIFKDFKEIVNDSLYEHKAKQVAVPYNISIGGGTQGLKENRTFGLEGNNFDSADLNLPLEQYFGGCFIGDMKTFKIFENPLTWCEIKVI